MPNILHRIGIKTDSIEKVYQILTTEAGLAGWWTRDTRGDGDQKGKVIEFRFDKGAIDTRVLALSPSSLVNWEVVAGPPEWIGTTISFELRQDGEYVILLFKHENWKEPVEFMHHCSTKWAIFLMSLKSLVETGKGQAAPEDVKIDDWN